MYMFDSSFENWKIKRGKMYTSPDIQNEIIGILGLHVLRDIRNDITMSPFISILIDEATDLSNREQLTAVVRFVNDELEVSEEFVGLYNVDRINSETLENAILDILLRLNIDIHKLRGQCYDGASVMSGTKTGVCTRILEKESRALYTHCYGHVLNLAANDTMKQISSLKESLETAFEICKLVKYSPQREAIFRSIKESTEQNSCGIRVMCPTRWSVRANSLKSILLNYETLFLTWDESLRLIKDTEMKARINGVSSQMTRFPFYFGIFLAELILRQTDNLSKVLQSPDISAAEGQNAASVVVETLKILRSEASFDEFWENICGEAEKAGVNEPQLPRKKRCPRRFDEGSSGDFHDSPKSHYRQIYFEAFDLIVNDINHDLNNPVMPNMSFS